MIIAKTNLTDHLSSDLHIEIIKELIVADTYVVIPIKGSDQSKYDTIYNWSNTMNYAMIIKWSIDLTSV